VGAFHDGLSRMKKEWVTKVDRPGLTRREYLFAKCCLVESKNNQGVSKTTVPMHHRVSAKFADRTKERKHHA
jgi:hypothetical protein